MEAARFEFDTTDLELHDHQRTFLDRVASDIRRLQPAQLDVAAVGAVMDDGAVVVTLPHRQGDELGVTATIWPDEAVVAYSVEHEHFWPDDPAHGRLWPVDAPDSVSAAARFVEQLLLGRVEIEVRRGFLTQRTKSYWINDVGARELFLQGGTVMPALHRQPPRVILVGFGPTTAHD